MAHVTAEAVPDVELIERVIILNAESPVIAYLLAQGVTPALVAEQTKSTLPKRLQDQCLWVPASIAHTRNRFVYGGVSIMPQQLNVLEAGTPRFNALYNQTFVHTSAGQTLVSASTFTAQASAFGGTPAAAAAGAPPTGGGGEGRGRPSTRGGSSGRGGRSPSPPDRSGHSSADYIRFKAILAFQEANILTQNEKLTDYALNNSGNALKDNQSLENPSVIKALTNDGSHIHDWGKFKTPPVRLSTGQEVEIHYYRNKKTGMVNYTHIDYKIKEIVQAAPRGPNRRREVDRMLAGEGLKRLGRKIVPIFNYMSK